MTPVTQKTFIERLQFASCLDDRAAFFHTYYSYIRTIAAAECRCYHLSQHEAEDIAAQVIEEVVIYRKINNYKPQDSQGRPQRLSSWLRGYVKNEAKEAARKSGRKRSRIAEDAPFDPSSPENTPTTVATSNLPSSQELLDIADLVQLIHSALENMVCRGDIKTGTREKFLLLASGKTAEEVALSHGGTANALRVMRSNLALDVRREVHRIEWGQDSDEPLPSPSIFQVLQQH